MWPIVERGGDRAELVRAAIRANVRASAEHLRRSSRILDARIGDGALAVVGAEYALETGQVDFFTARRPSSRRAIVDDRPAPRSSFGASPSGAT